MSAPSTNSDAPDEIAVVLVTTSSQAEADAIARTLVEECLAACGNIVGPIRSIYRWQGAVEEAAEHLLILKTRRSLFDSLRQRVVELHSYETPEIIALPVSAGSAAYLDWVRDATRGSP